MGTTEERLNYLNETKTQIKNILETPSNTFRDYPELIKKYIDNQPTKTVTDGICNNALKAPVVSISIAGNIRQKENVSPVDVHDIEIIDGANKFNKNNIVNGKYINEDGSIGEYYIYSISEFIKVKPNTDYFYTGLTDFCYYGAYYDKDKKLIGTFLESVLEEWQHVITPKNAKYMRVSLLDTDIDNWQIIEGALQKPYLSYECVGIEQKTDDNNQKLISIDLEGNGLAKVGEIKDKLKIHRNGNVEIEKNVGKIILNGTEEWETDWQNPDTPDYIQFYLNSSIFNNNYKEEQGKCSIFYSINDTVWTLEDEGWAIHPSSTYSLQFKFLKSRFANLEEFKTWLSTNNIEVYYELAKTQNIKLSSIEPVELSQGGNIFKLITNLETDIEIEYVVDKNSILEEVQTALLDAEIEI